MVNERFQPITTRDILGNVVLYQFDNPSSGTYFMLVPRAAGSFRYTVSAAFKNAIVVNTKYFMNDGPVARPISHPVQGNGHIFRLHLIQFFFTFLLTWKYLT